MVGYTDRTFKALEKAVDGAVTRQQAISHNLSNINTPGYKRMQVSFEDQLRQILLQQRPRLPLKTTREKHINNLPDLNFKPQITRDNSQQMRPDQNNVNVENEMVDMVKNGFYLNAVINQLNKRLAIIKYIDSDGRR